LTTLVQADKKKQKKTLGKAIWINVFLSNTKFEQKL
jgi:hypothetical protein